MLLQRIIRHPNKRFHVIDLRLAEGKSTMTSAFIVPLCLADTSPSIASQCQDRRPLVISGPSGVGKGTLCERLKARHPSLFATTVSHTTRAPRPGEVSGREYHFISPSEFEDLITQGAFVEHARFGGNNYGTSRCTIDAVRLSQRIPILDIEMEGVKQIKASGIPARFVFIAPPSMDMLERRLRGRSTDSEESIRKRLAQAHHEMAFAETKGAHDKIIVNDDLDTAYAELETFIFGN